MKYTCSVAMSPIDQLIELAKTAEEVGFDSTALPDSLFYMEKQSADYPYTADGSRINIVIPWIFDGLGFDAPLKDKQDSMRRFADTYIHSGWQDA